MTGRQAAARKSADEQDSFVDSSEAPASLSFGEFSDMIGFRLRLAQLAAFERVYALAGDVPLTLGEATIMLAVRENPGVRQGVIADELRIKWSNMTRLARSLEGRGLIRRVTSRRDRRSVELQLTAQGQALLEESMPVLLKADRDAYSWISREDLTRLIDLLARVANGDEATSEAKKRP